ncbi:tRNA synthetases class I (I, L, M and V) domain containing protein [Elaphomyces granulatus]
MPGLTQSLRRSLSSTLKLPKSTFPVRASPTDQVKYLQRCTDDLYAWQWRSRPADRTFILHDGPPYANGDLHVGHALNKILKDILCRVQLGLGNRVHYVPGWDCHGLPIELKALQSRGQLGGSLNIPAAAEVRKAARELAEKTVARQMEGFRSWAVMGDWSGHWKTMDKDFEMKQLGVFLEMVDRGLIYRRFKPVFWSPSSRTALAEAELEYREDHVSRAALVRFPLISLPRKLSDNPLVDTNHLSAVIWTTTPWTLPANRAIAISERLVYVVVQSRNHGQLLVAEARLEYLREILKDDLEVVLPSIEGSELRGQTTYRPLFNAPNSREHPIINANFVTDESGSGLVHCAPGHGVEDYEVCLAHGIPAYAPVSDDGKFTDEAMPSDPPRLSGKCVLGDGSSAVLEYIDSEHQLLAQHEYTHKYPYDWRSKLPVIVRATEQWFANVADIRDAAAVALSHVCFVPPSGKLRLQNFINSRTEWCISRQRAWGVPIPALYHRGTGDAILTKASVSHIMKVIEERGIDSWWTDDPDDPAWIPAFLRDSLSPGYRRGTDTMDVWFDSGTSWTQVEGVRGRNDYLADVYLEGTDQHRGWFQSGLLTFLARQLASGTTTVPCAPFKYLITHGFTLDQDARKMSKSIGNVIPPESIMNGTLLPPLKQKKGTGGKQIRPTDPVYDALGPDALRLWVASSDYTRDVAIGQEVLQTVHISLHKFRVTFKLLLGALGDFDTSQLYPYQNLRKIDCIALLHLAKLADACRNACQSFEFYRAVNAINKWANLDFSAFYMEAIKDRLYTEAENSPSRRAAQTTLYHIYNHLQTMLAPITPMLVEESWEHTPDAIKRHCQHPLQRIISVPPPEWQDTTLENDLPDLTAVNSPIKAMQECARSKKEMGSSLQSFVHICLPECSIHDSVFYRYLPELADLFVVSKVTLSAKGEPIPIDISMAKWSYVDNFELSDRRKGSVHVYAPLDSKCPRCWRYVVPETSSNPDMLCDRCNEVVSALEETASSDIKKGLPQYT